MKWIQANKRLPAVVMVLILMVMISLSGCSSSTSEEAPTSSANVTGSDGGDEASEASVPEEERVTITMQTSAFEVSFAAGRQDDPVMKAIEDELNINIEIIPENSIADVNAKLSAQMASRDLPDIVYVIDSNIQKQMISSKLALDLTPYKDQLNNVEDNRPGSFEASEIKYSVDIDNNPVDGLYFVGLSGSGGNPYRPTVGFYTRWDLYEELGYPEINSLDDYITLAQDMMELEPVNKDGKKNYGISGWFGQGGVWGTWGLHVPFFWESGIQPEPMNNVEFNFATDDIQPALTYADSMTWTGIEWWNKAYRAGIVDPNAFLQKWPEYLENVDASNRAFLSFADFTIKGGEAAFIEDGEPEKGYVALPSPIDSPIRPLYSYEPTGTRPYMVAANTEHPEEAVALLNYLASWECTMMIYNGIQGEDWDVIDGSPKFFDETITMMNEDPDYILKTGIYKYHNIAGFGGLDVHPEYEVFPKLQFTNEVLSQRATQAEQAACDYYGVEIVSEIVAEDKETTFNNTERYLAYKLLPTEGGEVGDRNKEIQAKLQSLFFDDIFEAVLAETEEDFQRIKAELIEKALIYGGEELFEYDKNRFYNGAE